MPLIYINVAATSPMQLLGPPITTNPAIIPTMVRIRIAIVVRIAWMAIFFLGAGASAWIEWTSEAPSAMAWFLISGVWSAACGVGYTLMHWYAVDQASRGTPAP